MGVRRLGLEAESGETSIEYTVALGFFWLVMATVFS